MNWFHSQLNKQKKTVARKDISTMASNLESPNGVTFLIKIKTEWRVGDKSLQMPLEWNSITSAQSLRLLLEKAFDFWWLFAFLTIMTKVMWDAAYSGNIWGFLNWLAIVASWGARCVSRIRHRDATRELVHATGFLQDAIVHSACRAEDHALGFRQTHTLRGAPGDICCHWWISPGRILQGKLVSWYFSRRQCLVYLKAWRRRLFSPNGRV